MGRTLFPNQRIVTIHRYDRKGSATIYTHFENDSLRNALKRLSGKKAGAMNLWLVFSMNRDGYTLPMSITILKDEYGITKDSYLRAWSVLQEEGFLQETGKNHYSFDEYPEGHRLSKGRETLPLKSRESLPLDESKVGKAYLQKSGNPTFKGRETLPDISIVYLQDTNIPKENIDNAEGCSCCSGDETTTTTTSMIKNFSQRYPIDDAVIWTALPELIKEYGPVIVESSLKQAYEGGSSKRNLRYIRGACAGKKKDPEKKRYSEEPPICLRDESIEDWN